MLTGKEMVMKNLRDYRLNPKIVSLITDKEQAMQPFLRYVSAHISLETVHCIRHGCRNPLRLVAVATKLFTMAPCLCIMSPLWHLES
jgi:hypothetical protein